MGALVATTPTNSGTVTAGAAVSASDTISQAIIGQKGAFLRINNANASSDNITISDAGRTGAGNALATGSIADTITNGTAQIYIIRPEQVDPTTLVVTITHSVTATVTYELWPLTF
jgi:hypothetical protein